MWRKDNRLGRTSWRTKAGVGEGVEPLTTPQSERSLKLLWSSYLITGRRKWLLRVSFSSIFQIEVFNSRSGDSFLISLLFTVLGWDRRWNVRLVFQFSLWATGATPGPDGDDHVLPKISGLRTKCNNQMSLHSSSSEKRHIQCLRRGSSPRYLYGWRSRTED